MLCIILTWIGDFIVLVVAIIFGTGTYYDMIPIFVGVLFIFFDIDDFCFGRGLRIIVIFVLVTLRLLCYFSV